MSHLGDLRLDQQGPVCCGSLVLCVSAVILCPVCDGRIPRRGKENGAGSSQSVFYSKVIGQVKEAQKLSRQSESGKTTGACVVCDVLVRKLSGHQGHDQVL